MSAAIRATNLSKSYRLGVAYRKTIREVANSFVFRLFARRPPHCDVGDSNTTGGLDTASSDMVFWALRDVSFEVSQGEVIGIIGANGAGKSTLLRILSQITTPSSGRAAVQGRVASLLEVGTGFHPELTGRENIFLNGAILGMTRLETRRKLDEIVAFAGIERFLNTPVKRYSSGMYIRLAFAVAAHLESEILLVDEVLAVGDTAFQEKCLSKMGSFAKEGRTVLFVSHHLNAVEDLCQKAILLDGGRAVMFDSDVRAVVNQYLQRGLKCGEPAVWLNSHRVMGNPWFQPLSFLLEDEYGRPATMPARSDANLWVKVVGTIERLHPALNIGYAVYTDNGLLLYWSLTTDTPRACWPALQVGEVAIRSRFPPRLLNEGSYRIDLVVSLHCREWISRPNENAPSLYLTIRGGLSDSPHWRMARPGVMAPVLHWETATPMVNIDQKPR